MNSKYHFFLLIYLFVLGVWSFIDRSDTVIWIMEAIPAIIAVALLVWTYNSFRLTNVSYTCIAIFSSILLIGAHYTYAEVPLFNTIRDNFDLSRNHFDRVGHFFQGFTPAIVTRELLLRTSPLRPSKWLIALILMSCLGISGAYELIEWIAAEFSGQTADAFVSMQGDVWDAQKDMALALLGATISLLTLSRLQNKQLARICP